MRKSKKFVGSSSSSRFGSWSSSAASLTRVCHPPESFADRALEIIPLQLELPGHFAAFPFGLAAIAHQKIMGRFARQKGIVLPQIAEPQFGMADDFAHVEFDLAEQYAQQRALAGAVSADEADFDIVDQRGLGAVQQNLVAVAFASILDLQQHSHKRRKSSAADEKPAKMKPISAKTPL